MQNRKEVIVHIQNTGVRSRYSVDIHGYHDSFEWIDFSLLFYHSSKFVLISWNCEVYDQMRSELSVAIKSYFS